MKFSQTTRWKNVSRGTHYWLSWPIISSKAMRPVCSSSDDARKIFLVCMAVPIPVGLPGMLAEERDLLVRTIVHEIDRFLCDYVGTSMSFHVADALRRKTALISGPNQTAHQEPFRK